MTFESKTNCEKIVNFVQNEIMLGNLKKGEKLPTERQMAEDMAVSRASVREAIKSLEAMGIVYSIQGSGTYVTDSPETTINRPLCALFALSGGTLDNLLQLRILLETESCKDIIENASNAEIASLSQLCMYDYENMPASEQAVHDSAFHFSMVQMSRNTMVKHLYTTLSTLIDIYREKVLIKTSVLRENSLTREDHLAIIAALMARSVPKAEEAIRKHLSLTETYREEI